MKTDLQIGLVIPAEFQTKDQAFGHALKRLRKQIGESKELSGYLSPLGDLELVSLQSAIRFVGATSHGTFSAAVRRYEKHMSERVLHVETKELNEGVDTPRKLYFAEQIRRVKAFKDASEGKGPFPKKIEG